MTVARSALLALLLGCGSTAQAAEKLVTITGVIYAAIPCVINRNAPINAPFGEVQTAAIEADADQRIKDAVMEFAAGDLIPADVGFKISGFDIGETVPYSTLFTPINQVIGAYGNSYVTLLQLNGAQANVVIDYNQMSRWTYDNITVVVT